MPVPVFACGRACVENEIGSLAASARVPLHLCHGFVACDLFPCGVPCLRDSPRDDAAFRCCSASIPPVFLIPCDCRSKPFFSSLSFPLSLLKRPLLAGSPPLASTPVPPVPLHIR